MVEVNQSHVAVHAGQSPGGVGDQRMRDLAYSVAWEFAGAKKGCVQQSYVHSGHKPSQVVFPLVPGINVWAVEQLLCGATHYKRQRVGKFVAMGHQERR